MCHDGHALEQRNPLQVEQALRRLRGRLGCLSKSRSRYHDRTENHHRAVLLLPHRKRPGVVGAHAPPSSKTGLMGSLSGLPLS